MSDEITVGIADDFLDRIDAVADQLRASGMEVDAVLRAAGLVTGRAPEAVRALIAQLPGVASVEAQHTTQLEPPESDLQ